jgi:hypothetical protein
MIKVSDSEAARFGISDEYWPSRSADYFEFVDPGPLTMDQARALWATRDKDAWRNGDSVVRFISDLIIVAMVDDSGAPFLLIQPVTEYLADYETMMALQEETTDAKEK